MSKKTVKNEEIIFYGPHPCEICGVKIAKACKESGGASFNYPDGPIYPNTVWVEHECGDLKVIIKSLRERVEALESDVKAKDRVIIIERKSVRPNRIQSPVYPWLINPPVWCGVSTATAGTPSCQGISITNLLAR